MDAGNRAGFHGILNALHWTTLGFDDFRFFSVSVQLKHFRTNLFTVAATDTFLFIDDHFLSHGRPRSDGWRYGDQSAQLAFRLEPVGLRNVANEHVPCASGKGSAVFRQELTDPIENHDAHLTFNIMGMKGEFLARPEIEIDDLEIGRIMKEEPVDGSIFKTARLIEVHFFHGESPFSQSIFL